MYFDDVIKVLLRRWYVVLVGMVAVAGALYYAFTAVPTQYQATGQVLILLQPKATGPNNPTNPYMNLSPGLVTTASIIAEQLNNNTNQASVEDAGFTSEYDLGVVPDTGPLLAITVKDTDPGEAEETLGEIFARVDDQLERMQANLDIPGTQLMHARRNDTNAGAEALPGSKVRAAGMLGGGGVVLTIVAAFLIDGLVRRREARRQFESDEPPARPRKPGGPGKSRSRSPVTDPQGESDEPNQRPRSRVPPNPESEALARGAASAKRR